jgi:hypothetical protein
VNYADDLHEALSVAAPHRPAPHEAPEGDTPLVRIQRGDEFLRSFKPPEPLIDGLLPRGQLYALTAPTGHGKTAIAALAQLCICTGRPFAGRDVEPGRVLVLAGENPDDYAMRLLATAQAIGLKPAEVALALSERLLVLPGSFALGPAAADIAKQVEGIGPLSCVFVDTSAAFFDADDENSNASMRLHASRQRSFTELPGRPAVLTLCHPVKHASRDNLLPRGGGAFLAEIDGNLTAWRDDRLVTMHWAGKLRGPGFDALTFELKPERLAITDSKGRDLVSVAAVPVSADQAEALEAAALSDENRMLRAMLDKPHASIAQLALAAGFVSGMGTPNKARAHRLLVQMATQGLAKKTRAGRWTLSSKGRSEADEVPAA